MKVWQVALGVVLILGLVAGVVVPGLAAPDKPGPPQARPPLDILKGTVAGLDSAQEFFVLKSGGEEVTVRVNEATRYYRVSFPAKLAEMARERLGPIMPRLKDIERQVPPPLAADGAVKLRLEALRKIRHFGEEAGYEDLLLGARVVVRTVAGEDEPLAKTVLILEPKTYGQVKGAISAISPQDMTLAILPDDGAAEVRLTFTDKTHFSLIGVTQVEVGQSARVIYNEGLVARLVIINPVAE